MKKLIILILLVFHAVAINAQERSVRVNVVKMDHVTTAERDLYVVPNNQTWKIYNTTTSQKEINVGGSGWVADTGSGGGTTYTASNGIQIVGSTDIQLSTAFKNTLDLIAVTQSVDLDDLSLDASGFNGNLSTTDDTLQEIAQTLDDISISAGTDDQTASEVPFTPNGSIAATNVQAAIQEVRDDFGVSNFGIVASGTATSSGTATITVNHNLGYIPDASRITLTKTQPSSGLNPPVINSITNMTLVFSSGTVGDTFSWKIFGANATTPLDGSEVVTLIDTELGQTTWKTGAVSSVNSQTGAVTLDTDDISDTAANNKYVDAAEKAKIANAIEGTISGRTGTDITKIMSQTEAQLASDGAANTGEIVFCSDCAPMAVQTTATIAVDDYRGYDDKSTDAATFTFSDLKAGAVVEIEINRATDATYSGITFATWSNEGSFSANTRQLVMIKILPSGDAIRRYIDLE